MRSFIGPLCRRYIFASYRIVIQFRPNRSGKAARKSDAQLCRQWLKNGGINAVFEKNRELLQEHRKLEISL